MTTTEPRAAQDVEVFCTPRAVAEAAPAWAALWRSVHPRDPFLCPGWHAAWWRTIGTGIPEIVVVSAGGRPIGVAPFARLADGALAFSGGEDVTDSLDVLAGDRAALVAIADHVAGTARRVELRWIRDGGNAVAALPALLEARGFAVSVAPIVVAPRVALPAAFDDYVASLGKKDRHELRRKLRRVESAGALTFSYAAGDETAPALERFIAWHRRSPGEKATFMTDAMARFFREAAAASAAAGLLRLGELRVGARPVGILFALEADGVLAAYNSAVDPDAAELSPGVLLHAVAIRDAIARGLAAYDFLRGGERYKYDLGGRDVTLWRVDARRPS